MTPDSSPPQSPGSNSSPLESNPAYQTTLVLMYHALYADEEEFHALLDEEKPYAVSTQMFEQQLELLSLWRRPVLHPNALHEARQPGVLLTFDDGHRSFYTHALPILKKRGLSALFFITTAFVGTDPRFCNWQELKEMHDEGMVIHAHGHSHQFFSDMPIEQAKNELKMSYELLRDNVHAPWSMSFPGGRFTTRDVQLAHAEGFNHVFTSEIDTLDDKAFSGQNTLARFAVKNTTDAAQFKNLVLPAEFALWQAKTLAKIKIFIKKALGNQMYHRLYTLKAKRR